MNKKIVLYSLTTSYVGSLASKTHFVHDLNKELANQGMRVKTIVPHSKNLLIEEIMDDVLIKRFRYLPERYEINSSSISDEVSKTKGGIFKIVVMAGVFLCFTFLECLKEKPDIFYKI